MGPCHHLSKGQFQLFSQNTACNAPSKRNQEQWRIRLKTIQTTPQKGWALLDDTQRAHRRQSKARGAAFYDVAKPRSSQKVALSRTMCPVIMICIGRMYVATFSLSSLVGNSMSPRYFIPDRQQRQSLVSLLSFRKMIGGSLWCRGN